MDGSTLAVVLDLVKGYAGVNQSSGVADDLMFKTLIERKQLFFTTRYSWSKLDDHWDVQMNNPQMRYVAIPTLDHLGATQTINFRRPVKVELYWSARWVDISYGIDSEQYNFINSDLVPPAVQDPIRNWARKAGDPTQFEVWPVTAGSPQLLRFSGQRVVGSLRTGATLDTTKVVELDDDMVALAVAADWLVKKNDKAAPQIASLAQSTFDTIRGDDPTATESFRIGSASDTDVGRVKRVVGMTVITA